MSHHKPKCSAKHYSFPQKLANHYHLWPWHHGHRVTIHAMPVRWSSRKAQWGVAILGVALTLVICMNRKTQHSSGSVSKEAFLAVLKKFTERYGPTEITITTTRQTESRYQWLAEYKSKLSRYFAAQSCVVYAYTISGSQLLVETDEHRNLILAVRIHPGNSAPDMSTWLVTELRKLSPAFFSKVSVKGGK